MDWAGQLNTKNILVVVVVVVGGGGGGGVLVHLIVKVSTVHLILQK